MKQYKALIPLGRFKKGDFVGGLSEAEIKKHLFAGNIEEVKPSTSSKPATKEVKANG